MSALKPCACHCGSLKSVVTGKRAVDILLALKYNIATFTLQVIHHECQPTYIRVQYYESDSTGNLTERGLLQAFEIDALLGKSDTNEPLSQAQYAKMLVPFSRLDHCAEYSDIWATGYGEVADAVFRSLTFNTHSCRVDVTVGHNGFKEFVFTGFNFKKIQSPIAGEGICKFGTAVSHYMKYKYPSLYPVLRGNEDEENLEACLDEVDIGEILDEANETESEYESFARVSRGARRGRMLPQQMPALTAGGLDAEQHTAAYIRAASRPLQPSMDSAHNADAPYLTQVEQPTAQATSVPAQSPSPHGQNNLASAQVEQFTADSELKRTKEVPNCSAPNSTAHKKRGRNEAGLEYLEVHEGANKRLRRNNDRPEVPEIPVERNKFIYGASDDMLPGDADEANAKDHQTTTAKELGPQSVGSENNARGKNLEKDDASKSNIPANAQKIPAPRSAAPKSVSKKKPAPKERHATDSKKTARSGTSWADRQAKAMLPTDDAMRDACKPDGDGFRKHSIESLKLWLGSKKLRTTYRAKQHLEDRIKAHMLDSMQVE